MKAIFFDRDDTLLVDTKDFCVNSADKINLFPDTLEALATLAKLDYSIVLVTNQEVISAGRLSEAEFWGIHQAFLDLIRPSGITVLKTCMCPHTTEDNCVCRKPKPFMIQQAAREFGIALQDSWMIGDRDTDVQAGNSAGTRTILVKTGQVPVTGRDATYLSDTLLGAVRHIVTAAKY